MPSMLELDAQLDALDWTPLTASACVTDLCAILKNAPMSAWYHFAPRISAGLTCLASEPDELYRLAVHMHTTSKLGEKILLGKLLAGVDAELPEHIASQAITHGTMMPLLYNRNYTIAQRLSWRPYPSILLRLHFLRGH